MKKTLREKVKAILPTLLGVVFLLVAWFVCFVLVGNDRLVVSPIETLKAMGALLVTKGFYLSFGATLLRAFCAMAVSVAVAFPDRKSVV